MSKQDFIDVAKIISEDKLNYTNKEIEQVIEVLSIIVDFFNMTKDKIVSSYYRQVLTQFEQTKWFRKNV
jgi:hypothetical protein